MEYYYTLYETPYGTVKAKLKTKMRLEDAEKISINYCDDYNYIYHGTFTEDEIEDAHDMLRHNLYNT